MENFLGKISCALKLASHEELSIHIKLSEYWYPILPIQVTINYTKLPN